MSVTVIVGVGGMGLACARRIGFGQRLLLADFNAASLQANAIGLKDAGYDVTTQTVDVADPASVAALAAKSRSLGPLRALVHTAGLSPTMASSQRIFAVDLLGTALVMDAFLSLAEAGSAAVMIASMAPHFMQFDAEIERQLATVPTAQLLAAAANHYQDDPYGAYALSKRGNQLRVQAAAPAWGKRGARINSISPGLIHTAMHQQEEKGNPMVASLRAGTPLDRYGTPEDIAAGVEWLVGSNSNFISGIDLLIDGGLIAQKNWPTN